MQKHVGGVDVVESVQRGSLLSRMLRAARLDPELYAEVRSDRTATIQAISIVMLVGVAHGVATIVRALLMGWWSSVAMLVAFLFEVGLWLTVASATYVTGRVIFGSAAKYGEVLRPLGFATTPGLFILLAVLLSGTLAQAPALVVLALWRLAAAAVAACAALRLRLLTSLASFSLGLVAGLACLGVGISFLWRLLGEG